MKITIYNEEYDVNLALYDTTDFMGIKRPSLAIFLSNEMGESFVTVSFGEFIGLKNATYMDINNAPFVTEFIKQGYAQDTGCTKNSGFVNYPLYEFDAEFLKSCSAETYAEYEKEYNEAMNGFICEEDEDPDDDDE
jgi:hypothetical protein